MWKFKDKYINDNSPSSDPFEDQNPLDAHMDDESQEIENIIDRKEEQKEAPQKYQPVR